jgi:hypothetical protein
MKTAIILTILLSLTSLAVVMFVPAQPSYLAPHPAQTDAGHYLAAARNFR